MQQMAEPAAEGKQSHASSCDASRYAGVFKWMSCTQWMPESDVSEVLLRQANLLFTACLCFNVILWYFIFNIVVRGNIVVQDCGLSRILLPEPFDGLIATVCIKLWPWTVSSHIYSWNERAANYTANSMLPSESCYVGVKPHNIGVSCFKILLF